MLILGLAAKLNTPNAVIDVSIMGWGVPGLPKPQPRFLSQLLSMKEKGFICLFVDISDMDFIFQKSLLILWEQIQDLNHYTS